MAGALGTGADAQILGTAETFGVLAGSTVTNTGSSVLMGNVGVSPGGAVVGFPPGIVVAPGTIHAGDAVAGQAQIDLTTAYNTLQALPSQVNLTGQNLGGLFLSPAVYSFATSAQLTGVLTLNGQGNPAAQFVFQIGTTLTTASNSAVLLINGANGNNVYWAVGSSATLGTNTAFAGNIVALTSITLNTGATITCGRALARNGAVTLDNNTITLCAAAGGGGGGGGGGGAGGGVTFNDLFGEGVSGAQQTALGAAGLFGSTILGQAAFWRDNPERRPRSLKDGPADGGPDGIASEDPQHRTWRSWATGFGGFATEQGSAALGSADLDTHTAGIAVGIDLQIDRTALIGIAGAYTVSGYSVDQRFTTGTTEGGHVALYGVKRLGPFYLAGTAEYAHFYNTTDRFIDFVVDERAVGDFASDAYSGRLEAGWRRYFANHSVTPFAGLEVTHLRTAGFSENSVNVLGGPGILGLAFAPHSLTSLESSLGIQFDTRVVFSSGHTLTPFARAAWVHEFEPDRGVTASLLASPAVSFSSEGAPAASDLARVTAGLKLDVRKNAALFGYFTGDFSDRTQSYAGTGGVRITW